MTLIRTPRSVDIEITGRCNLRCKYCSHFTSGSDVREDLPAGEWLEFFEELRDCSVMEVCLQGGEAFIREDFAEILNGIVQNRMRFSILTNGTLITREIAAFLASTRRCNFIQVSIDGSMPITHDSFRGNGSFRRAVEGLKLLLDHRLPASVRVTIHRRNVNDLEKVSKLLLEVVGLPGFSTNSAGYLGLCRKNTEEVQLTVEERCLAMDSLLKLTEKYGDRISASAGPLAEAHAWLEIENARKKGLQSLPGGGHLTSCGGPMTKLAVRADGVMVPCVQLSNIELGRINVDSLAEVWRNSQELNRLRDRSSIPLADFDFCRGCEYVDFCRGGCPAMADSMIGNPYHPSPDSCYKRFLEAGGVLPDEDSLTTSALKG
ncbi:MAG: SynChlorMet cassette radical SAM/SPASM protein ScmE [Desulfomonilaceae bacterium]